MVGRSSNARSIRVPLAWRNLTASRRRFLTSLAGAAFAVVLMFLQTGFRQALVVSMAAALHFLDGDLALISRSQYTIFVSRPFPARRLDIVSGYPEVASVAPVYIEARLLKWRRLSDGLPQRIRVLAIRPNDTVFRSPEILSQQRLLEQPDTALADRLSKPDIFGAITVGSRSELGERQLEVVGSFALGADFQIHGNLLVSEETFLARMPGRRGASHREHLIDVGVIRTRAGVDAKKLRDTLAPLLPNDVMLLTREEYVNKEQHFWDKVTPIGIVFNIGVVMGFLVGLIVCYQVLFAEIADHLAEFATLKAMGYTHGWLYRVILTEALYLSALGYLVGLGVSWLLYLAIEATTGLPMRMEVLGSAVVYALTTLMCVLAAMIAGRKLVSAEPADLFH